MRLSIGIVGLALLAGCVTVHEVKGPDGKTALAVQCPDALACYKKAGELCPDGYNLVGNNSENHVGSSNYGTIYSSTTTTLVVECKPQKGAGTPATTKN
jgi:hypothetical protein